MERKKLNKYFNKGENLSQCLPILAQKAEILIRDLDPLDELAFLRVKTKNHEIMYAPDQEYQIFTIYDY